MNGERSREAPLTSFLSIAMGSRIIPRIDLQNGTSSSSPVGNACIIGLSLMVQQTRLISTTAGGVVGTDECV